MRCAALLLAASLMPTALLAARPVPTANPSEGLWCLPI
jgi:hypothetical protein